jgi:hypothetical protein
MALRYIDKFKPFELIKTKKHLFAAAAALLLLQSRIFLNQQIVMMMALPAVLCFTAFGCQSS